MPRRFDEADLSRIKPIPIATRASKVRVEDIVDPRGLAPRAHEDRMRPSSPAAGAHLRSSAQKP